MRRDFVFRLLFTIEMRVLSLIVCFGLASLAVVEAAPDKISQYKDSAYEFMFPMVVGLRYIPQPSTLDAAPDTGQIPGAARTIPTKTELSSVPVKTRSALNFNFSPDGKITDRKFINKCGTMIPLAMNEIRHITVSSGILNSAAIKKVMPVCPPQARCSGSVQVLITINEEGKVEFAEVLNGHPLIRASAVEAARQWIFKPWIIDGPNVYRVHGVLTFNFKPDTNGLPTVAIETPVPSANLRQLWPKLHPSISAVIERLATKANPTANESTFVRNGQATVQVQLTDKTKPAIAKLKRLGFLVEQNPQSSKPIIGRLPIEKLEALAGLEIVRYVSPLSRK